MNLGWWPVAAVAEMTAAKAASTMAEAVAAMVLVAAAAAHRHRSCAAKLPSCQHEPQRWGATPKTLPPKEIIAADEKESA